jgi:putative addiction module CopG family antidote
MAHSQTLRITLSDEMVAFIRDRVSSGEYESESEVIGEGLEALKHEADERRRFEQEVVLPAYERYLANPASAIPAEEVERHLEERRRQRSQAK